MTSADDGSDSRYTEKLLDEPKERNVRATFFVLGKQAEKYPEIIARIQEEGHLIGNHTYSHMQIRKSNREKFKEELKQTSEIINGIIGEELQYVRHFMGAGTNPLNRSLACFQFYGPWILGTGARAMCPVLLGMW